MSGTWHNVRTFHGHGLAWLELAFLVLAVKLGQDIDFLGASWEEDLIIHIHLGHGLIINEGSPRHNAHAIDFLAHDLLNRINELTFAIVG